MKNISPHVQIYKFPVTAISSITTRLTGLGLTGLYVGYGTLCFFNKQDLIIDKYNALNDNYKKVINYGILTSTVYHTLGGIRHFVWDKFPSKFLNNKSVSRSSFLLFGLTIPLTYASEKFLEYNKCNQKKNNGYIFDGKSYEYF